MLIIHNIESKNKHNCEIKDQIGLFSLYHCLKNTIKIKIQL
jgi:hypothetical protein